MIWENGIETCIISYMKRIASPGSMPFSQIILPSPSPAESKSLFYTSVSLLLSRIQGYHYHLSKFHVYVLIYCICVFFFTLFYFTILYWFSHTLTWIHHRCTWVPNPEPPCPDLSPHIISLGHPSAPAPSILYAVSNLDWQFVSYMILYMFQCQKEKHQYSILTHICGI